jgi:uncharacterized protein (TIGR03435 family)
MAVVYSPPRLLERAVIFVLLYYLPSGHVRAQSNAMSRLPEFEVATVKPVDPNLPHMVGVKVYPGGRVVISSLSLRSLIGIAFRLSYWQISGGEGWIGKDEFDLEAKPSESMRSTVKDLRSTPFAIEDEQLRKMLQAVLIERFQLTFHREAKTADVYHLTRSAKRLRLHPAEVSPGGESISDRSPFGTVGYAAGRWVISRTTMPQLAQFASDFVVRAPVVDRTDLNGAFDYRQASSDPDPNSSEFADSFLRLISELGLKLEHSKGTVETLVIDHAAKPSPD